MPLADYETIELLKVIERSNPITKFFTKFFPNSNTHLAERILVDVKKSRRRMAPFVAKRIGGKLMDRDGFNTYQIGTPKIAPERIITMDDVTNRSAGENIYSTKTPEERADEMLAKDMVEMEEYIQNRIEWMCRNVILWGKLDVVIPEDGVDFQVDYNFSNFTQLVGGAVWTQNTADPYSDVKNLKRNIISKAGVAPSCILMGVDAFEAFAWHPKMKERLNLLNMNLGKIEPKIQSKALTFQGEFPELGQIYTYEDWFVDDEDNEQPFVPQNKILLLPDTIGSIEYGVVHQQENGIKKTYEGKIVPKKIVDDDNDMTKLRLTSRPLPVPFDVDAWAVANVL